MCSEQNDAEEVYQKSRKLVQPIFLFIMFYFYQYWWIKDEYIF